MNVEIVRELEAKGRLAPHWKRWLQEDSQRRWAAGEKPEASPILDLLEYRRKRGLSAKAVPSGEPEAVLATCGDARTAGRRPRRCQDRNPRPLPGRICKGNAAKGLDSPNSEH